MTAVFFVVTTAQGITRANFDVWHQAVSALSLGPGGWVQSVSLVCFGLVIVWSAHVWRRVLAGGVGARWYPLLTAITGCGFVLVGVFTQDPAPGYDPENLQLTRPTLSGLLHLLFAAIASLSAVCGLFVMAKRFSGDPRWKAWVPYTVAIALVMVVCIAIYAVWSTSSTGYAGSFERAAMVLPALWTFVFVRRLWRGVPFTVDNGIR